MVRVIVNGEIVDRADAPPAEARGAASPGDGAPPPSAAEATMAQLFGARPTTSRPTFDLTLPPFAVVPPTGAGVATSLPGVAIFGAVATGPALLGLAAALFFLGFGGGVLYAMAWVALKLNAGGEAGSGGVGGGRPRAPPPRRAAAAPAAPSGPSSEDVRAATRAAWEKRGAAGAKTE